MARLSKTKRFLFFSIAFLAVFSIVVLISEAAIRFSGKYRLGNEIIGTPYHSAYGGDRLEHIYHYPGGLKEVEQPRNEFVHYRKINSIGFTDPRELEEIDALSEDTLITILAAGDSYTEGMGTSVDSSWPALLEQQLNTSNSKQKFLVYNAGVSGCDPLFSYQNLKFLQPKIKPQVFILSINFSDYVDVYLRGGWDRFQPDGTTVYVKKAPWWEPYYVKSHLVRALIASLGYNDLMIKDLDYDKLMEVSYNLIEQAVDSCKMYCDERGILFIPVFHPTPFDADSERCDRQNHTFVTNYLAPNNPNYLDMTLIVRRNESAEFFWPIDRHGTGKGYLIFAQVIKEHLLYTSPQMFSKE